jgi:hypothetical protein
MQYGYGGGAAHFGQSDRGQYDGGRGFAPPQQQQRLGGHVPRIGGLSRRDSNLSVQQQQQQQLYGPKGGGAARG